MLLTFLLIGDLNRDLAERWAPIIFHEEAMEFTDPVSGFNPVESLVDPRFDGNLNLRDNVSNVFRVSSAEGGRLLEEIPIFYHVIETRTHFYLNFILYHAVDWGFKPHAHDTENIWTVLKKGDRAGEEKLVAHVLSAHGFPMIYSPDPELQSRWRNRLTPSLARSFLPALDPNSEEHQGGQNEYTIDSSQSLRLHVFVTSRTHALYKSNLRVWNATREEGSVLIPGSCRACWRGLPEQVSRGSLRAYRLKPWDDFLNDLMASERRASESERELISTALRSQFQPSPVRFLNPHMREVDLPGHMTPAYGEARPGASLFHRISFKTPHRLSDPARMHIFFEGSSGEISTYYLQNSLMQPVSNARPKRTPQVFEASLADWFQRALGF